MALWPHLRGPPATPTVAALRAPATPTGPGTRDTTAEALGYAAFGELGGPVAGAHRYQCSTLTRYVRMVLMSPATPGERVGDEHTAGQ